MCNWKANNSQNTQFVTFLKNIIIICNSCNTVTIIDTCSSDNITAHGKAVIHYVEVKFENKFGNKIHDRNQNICR